MSSFISEINKLKNIQKHLEKHNNTFIDNFSKSNQNTELYDLRLENVKSRQKQQDKLQNEVISIMNPLKKINESLKKKNLKKLDVKTVRKDMTGIQTNIKNLNDSSQTSLEELKKEEQTLLTDLQSFQLKVDKWEKRYSVTPKSLRRSVSTPENISTEVKTFMEFVANTGGHENGWNVDDHALFLRIRNKTKDNNKLAEVVHAMLPDISENEVLSHELWYIKYLELRGKQKDSIKNWRASKSNVQKSPPTIDIPEKINAKNSYTDGLQKELTQERLHAWKSEKLLQNKFRHKQKQQELVKIKEEEQARKQKQEELRIQVNNWKISKRHAEEEERLRREEEERREQKERAVRANKLIKDFQNHDELFIQNKLQLLHGQNKLPPIVNSKHRDKKYRDRSRLLQPTQQWILRKYSGPTNDNHTNNMNIQVVPKLRMPEWRRYII